MRLYTDFVYLGVLTRISEEVQLILVFSVCHT